MKTLSVLRTNTSPYHGQDFNKIERNRINSIPGLTFLDSQPLTDFSDNILITNTHTRLSEIPSKLLGHTQLIIHSNSGYDNFAQDRERWWNIPVIIGHEIRAQAVAEYYLNAILVGLAELPQHLQWSKARTWSRPLLRDQEIWIFGHGHIGKKISAVLAALGCHLTIIDPFQSENYPTWKYSDLSKARIILACCSLNSTSKHLFGEVFFKSCHPQLIFINAARGGLVDENALRSFLLSNPESQAFLDVFETEPFNQNWQHFPQVWKTSHIAGVYADLDEMIINFEERILKDFTQLTRPDFLNKHSQSLLQNKWFQGELI